MPRYRFRCSECCEEFIKRLSVEDRDTAVTCPNCQSDRTDRKMTTFSTGGSNSGGKSG